MAKQAWPGQRGGRGAVRFGGPLALLLASSAALAQGAPPARAATVTPEQESREKQAMALHDEARDLYEHGHYRAAITSLEAALALDPEGKELVYNLALIHERLGEVDPAARYYRRYLEMETAPKERERIQGVLQRLEGAKPDLVVAKDATPPPAWTPRPPAPPPPPPVARPLAPWIMVSATVGAMGLFTGAVLGISALARNPGASAVTGPGVSAEDILLDARAAHRQAIGADISFAIGVAAGGAALAFYYASRVAPPPPKVRASRVDLAVGPLAGAVRVRF